MFRLEGSADGCDCHVDRDVRSPVSVKVQREGCCTNGKGRLQGVMLAGGSPLIA